MLIVEGSLEDTAKKLSLSPVEVNEILEKCRILLYKERQKRPKPHLDDKIVAAWNGKLDWFLQPNSYHFTELYNV